MKKTTSFLAVLVALFSSRVSLAQSAGNAIYNSPYERSAQRVSTPVNIPSGNQVYLQAEVMINVKATSYAAIFSATQNGITASETDSLMNIRLRTVRAAMKSLGIMDDELHVDVISLVPTYALKLEEKKFTRTANEIPTGFQLKKNIHVIFYDHVRLSEIIAQMAKAEIYDIVKVDYNLADLPSAYDTLRKAATRIVRMKEKEYPKMGLHLSVENMSDGFEAAYPLERYASYTAYHTGSSVEEVKLAKKRKERAVMVTGKNATVNVNASAPDENDARFIVNYSDKARTIYYNKVPYNQFDLVINADFVEARIQLIYTLKVRYTVMNAEKNREIKETEKEIRERARKKDR